MKFSIAFEEAIHQHHERLSEIPLSKVHQKPVPEKWSPIEILGHLLDSACNNHCRFVKAQWQTTMIFDGYQQVEWVKVQAYQTTDWQQLLDLWLLYNLHICRIMENTSEEKLKTAVKEHNLHQIAMRTVPAEQTVTLEYFMKDYIFHIEHHLKQIYYLTE